MSMVISTAGIPVLVLAGLPIFVILFVTISRALKQTPMFNGNAAVVVALGTTLLCMAGLYRTFVAPGNRETAVTNDTPSWLDLCLLPYTAMALALLFVLVLLLARRFRAGREATKSRGVMKRRRQSKALRESPGREALNSVCRGLSRLHQKGKSGRTEYADRLKKLRTDLQNKETMK